MGSFYMESTQINYRRDDTLKTVDQKLQELSETSAIDTDIAPVFKSTNTYAPGDMVYYRNKLYVFNVEHTGAWAAADVTATDVTTELSSLNSNLMSGLTNVDVSLSVPNGTGKNRLTNTATTTTTNGVTFTVNDDGTVTLNGETTAEDTNFTILNPWTVVGNYILNGVPESAPSGTKLQAFMTGKTVDDTGSGVALNVVSGDTYRIRIVITGTGIVFNNVTIKPMLRLASVTDPSFSPYIPSVESRIEAVEVSLVAQSGSTGTIAAKLNSMVSALNALSTDRKRNAVLLMGTTVFHIANTQSNQFTQASYSANTTTTTIRCIDMIANASTYNVTRLTTSGVSMEDVSSTENTTVFYLYA